MFKVSAQLKDSAATQQTQLTGLSVSDCCSQLCSCCSLVLEGTPGCFQVQWSTALYTEPELRHCSSRLTVTHRYCSMCVATWHGCGHLPLPTHSFMCPWAAAAPCSLFLPPSKLVTLLTCCSCCHRRSSSPTLLMQAMTAGQ
jgi:hypothetical protein